MLLKAFDALTYSYLALEWSIPYFPMEKVITSYQGMTERRYFNVDPDRRSKFWNLNGTAFKILELELNGDQF